MSRPFTLIKAARNTYQAAVWPMAGEYLVTEWSQADDTIRTVECFPYDGPARGDEARLARARAFGLAKRLVLHANESVYGYALAR